MQRSQQYDKPVPSAEAGFIDYVCVDLPLWVIKININTEERLTKHPAIS